MILQGTIEQVYSEQSARLNKLDGGLGRETDLQITSLSSHALIISGIRRCGKSTLLLQMLRKTNEAFYFNFETPKLYGFTLNDFERLDKLIQQNGAHTLFFDEIQVVEGWERYVRQKLDEEFKVIITGSNASLLSSELGTKLTGRHISIVLYPFSYSEFLKFQNCRNDSESLSQYMQEGGFPEYLKTGDEEQLLQLFNDILLRDIVVRYNIKDIKSLQQLAQFLVSNIGNRITAGKLKQNFSVSATSTISAWFSYLEQSYLVSFLPVYSTSIRAQVINPRKVYAIDTGLVNYVSTQQQNDFGHKLENMVFLHLKRKYKYIYYFDDNGECDFVAFHQNKVAEIVQVCYEINRDNIDRELKGLTKAMDSFNQKKACIITGHQTDKIIQDGKEIMVIPAYEYFLI